MLVVLPIVDGTNAGTTFTDSSASPYTITETATMNYYQIQAWFDHYERRQAEDKLTGMALATYS